jgi:Tol biopolymer transport system component
MVRLPALRRTMRLRIISVGMLLLLSAAITVAMQNGNDLYQQGLARETAGDIKGAIQIFERIVRDFSSNRTLTAKALLQLGRWSDLLGEDQGRKYYERLIREFSDQPEYAEVVSQAKARLAPSPTTAAAAARPLPDISRNWDSELLTVSPDGTKAIVIDYTRDENLAIYDFSTTQKRLLTDREVLNGGHADFALWSPDSRRVAFMLAAWIGDASELRVTTLDGRSTLVYRNDEGVVRPVGWTRDGATLVVVLGRADKTATLGTLPATGGRFTPLRSFTWSANRGGGFRLSPDGRFVAYEQGEEGLRDIYVVSIDGRDAYRITDHPADDFAPIWSPDSQHLAFMSSRSGTVSLWTVEVKGAKPAGQPVKVMDGMQSAQLVDWVERGIFFSQTMNTSDLYTVATDPVDLRPKDMPQQIPYPRTGSNIHPIWSPDGRRLAFVSSSAAEPNRKYVVVMTAEGGQTHEFPIPTFSYQGNSPYDLRWFGDGRGLGFSGLDTRGRKVTFRLLLEKGEWDLIPLSMQARWTRVDWNRDGSAFYFVRWGEANAGIFEREVSGDAERLFYRLAEKRAHIRALNFSPDHSWLAFQQDNGDGDKSSITRIVIANVVTGEARTILEKTIDSGEQNDTLNLLGWSPSGELLVWRPGTGGAPADWLLAPVNGGAPRSIAIPAFTPPAPLAKTRPFDARWSPDGRSLVVVRESRGYQIFVIENPVAAVRATAGAR